MLNFFWPLDKALSGLVNSSSTRDAFGAVKYWDSWKSVRVLYKSGSEISKWVASSKVPVTFKAFVACCLFGKINLFVCF